MKVVVGLGNPGEQYKNTRHNIGWLALDYLLGDVRWQENKKFRALVHEDNGTIYLKPLTFMNNSGDSVRRALDYYGLLPKNLGLIRQKDADLKDALTVIQDDLDLDFGNLKTAVDSSSAGHRGIQSIIDQLKTKKFTRWRLGIKNEYLRAPIPPEKFVLQPFSQEEKKGLEEIFSRLDKEKLR